MKRQNNAAPLGGAEYQLEIGAEPQFDTVTTPGQEVKTLLGGEATQEFAGKDGIPGGPVNSYTDNLAPPYSRIPKAGGE